MSRSFMEIMGGILSNTAFSIPVTCLAIIFLAALIIISYISCRQRRRIIDLMRQLEEGEKAAQLAQHTANNSGIVVIQETPASQVWESDECVFYDLGSVSRAGSCDDLDMDSDSGEEAEDIGKKSNDLGTDKAGEDEGVVETTSLGLGASEKKNGSTVELTEEIWVGGEDVTKEKLGEKDMVSLNDALSDMGPADDSGNETTSIDDPMSQSGEDVQLTDEETGIESVPDKKVETGTDLKEAGSSVDGEAPTIQA